jgi:hypothetical protein
MNVLLLTPDAVGGTLLHTLLTAHMQFNRFDQPVIGIHDIAYGLEKFYSEDFGKEILRVDKKNKYSSQNHQSLGKIQELLGSVDHYTVAKLTQYIIRRRDDPLSEQVPFYNYLNDNFYIISCRRRNVFEHALSWSINKITKKMNFFSHDEKINLFAKLYKDGLRIDPMSLKQSLDDYKSYLKWSDANFSVASYYYYEDQLDDIENFIINLPIFNQHTDRRTWGEVYGIGFNDWNKYHYFKSDIGGVALDYHTRLKELLSNANSETQLSNDDFSKENEELLQKFIKKYDEVSTSSWPKIQTIGDYENLPDYIKTECREVYNICYFLDRIYINNRSQDLKYTPILSKYAPALTMDTKVYNNELAQYIHETHSAFLTKYKEKYNDSAESIQLMVDLGILSSTIPIKKQTLSEKIMMIKNIDECIDMYNAWISENPDIGKKVSFDQLQIDSAKERYRWTNTTTMPMIE